MPTSSIPSPSTEAAESSKAVITHLYELINRGELASIGELLAADVLGASGQRGREAFLANFQTLRAAFPDLRYTIDAMVAEGDRVAVRWSWTGTHRGAFRSIAATNKAVTSVGMAIFELAGGKITATSLQTDRLGFLQALGVIPYDPAFGPSPSTGAASPSSPAR